MSRQTVYLLSDDLDGWLCPVNRSILPENVALLSRLQGLSLETDTGVHRVETVLTSGVRFRF